ncbi:hypothetical protein J3458_015681 [Metarhizium acridum]|uniref:uncharacterized protein n=1 Tax=Metarhizium acridum TaxID=92637 RepID=UPI001C6B81A9|nr:hypothetical protein J3458_015681 [Metarhizium acridum]
MQIDSQDMLYYYEWLFQFLIKTLLQNYCEFVNHGNAHLGDGSKAVVINGHLAASRIKPSICHIESIQTTHVHQLTHIKRKEKQLLSKINRQIMRPAPPVFRTKE